MPWRTVVPCRRARYTMRSVTLERRCLPTAAARHRSVSVAYAYPIHAARRSPLAHRRRAAPAQARPLRRLSRARLPLLCDRLVYRDAGHAHSERRHWLGDVPAHGRGALAGARRPGAGAADHAAGAARRLPRRPLQSTAPGHDQPAHNDPHLAEPGRALVSRRLHRLDVRAACPRRHRRDDWATGARGALAAACAQGRFPQRRDVEHQLDADCGGSGASHRRLCYRTECANRLRHHRRFVAALRHYAGAPALSAGDQARRRGLAAHAGGGD